MEFCNVKSLPHSSTRILAAFAVATFAIISAAAAQNDSNFSLFNPAKGVWYSNSPDGCAFTAVRWGSANDTLVPADYDGDGQIDAAVWRPDSGTWLIKRSRDTRAQITRFGNSRAESNGFDDVPVPADYDGDKIADLAIWRPTTGEWLILSSSNGLKQGKTDIKTLGVIGDIPVQADYDGDGKTDVAIFRGKENRWFVQQSSDGQIRSEVFGRSGQDVLVPADFTGDGKADMAVYRSGTWFVFNSETGEIEPFVFGFKDDIAAPGDYDGDGTADFAVFRKGTWYIYDSGTPKFRTFNFGNESDIPLNSLTARKSFSP
jgi:hypothetical protein